MAKNDHMPGKTGVFVFLVVVETLIWAMLIYSPGMHWPAFLEDLAVGFVVALVATALAMRVTTYSSTLRYLAPKRVFHLIIYLFILIKEIIKANLNMARIVISPELPIKPGIVKIKTDLKNPVAKLLLANSITLTPGTMSVNVDGDTLYIHWVYIEGKTPEERGEIIKGVFERHLREVFE